jgi:hypothetical protein
MPDRKFHEKRAQDTYGDPWVRVHAWLDGLAFGLDGRLDVNHRRHRHHLGGVQTVRRNWGETAEAVARQHITDDEGCVRTEEEMKKIYPDAPEWKSLGYERKRKKKETPKITGET